MMDNLQLAVLSSGDIVPLVAVGGGFAVIMLSIIFRTIRHFVSTKAKEETKREIAAYVAEGSISPEDAERILNADRPSFEDIRGNRKG